LTNYVVRGVLLLLLFPTHDTSREAHDIPVSTVTVCTGQSTTQPLAYIFSSLKAYSSLENLSVGLSVKLAGNAPDYGLDGRCSIPDEVKVFSNPVSRLALGPTQTPIQGVPEALSPGENGRGVKVTTYVHLLPR
jgi:hypothetical protein